MTSPHLGCAWCCWEALTPHPGVDPPGVAIIRSKRGLLMGGLRHPPRSSAQLLGGLASPPSNPNVMRWWSPPGSGLSLLLHSDSAIRRRKKRKKIFEQPQSCSKANSYPKIRFMKPKVTETDSTALSFSVSFFLPHAVAAPSCCPSNLQRTQQLVCEEQPG